jgi:hypothetical protein
VDKDILIDLKIKRVIIGSQFLTLYQKDKDTKKYQELRKKLVDIKQEIYNIENTGVTK